MKWFSRIRKHKKKDVLKRLRFVEANPFGDANATRSDIVCWLVPDYAIGSGGHTTIFRMVYLLERMGIRCLINIDGKNKFGTSTEARDDIRSRFFPIEAEVTLGREGIPPCKALVATAWGTAYTARDFLACGQKYYFVQDFEPLFYESSSSHVFAENTYRFGFKGITAGGWLAQLLTSQYGMSCAAFGFSYDRDIYFPATERKQGKPLQLFYYARPETPRRGLELALLTLQQVVQKIPDIDIVMAGGNTDDYLIPFKHRNLGVLSVANLAEVYRTSDAALVLSFTNLSLLPIELMASGCVVVSNRGPCVEWMLNEDNAILAEPTPEAMTQAIITALQDEPLRARKIQTGLAFAHMSNWETEAKKVARLLDLSD